MRFKEHQGRQVIRARARRKRVSSRLEFSLCSRQQRRGYASIRASIGQTCVSFPSERESRAGKIPRERISTLCTTKQVSHPPPPSPPPSPPLPLPFPPPPKLTTLVRFARRRREPSAEISSARTRRCRAVSAAVLLQNRLQDQAE